MINIDVHFGGSNGALAPGSQTGQLSSLSAQSFTTFLSEALSETLSKFGIDPSSFQLTLSNQPGQTTATSPNPVTSAPGAAAFATAPPAAISIPATIGQASPTQAPAGANEVTASAPAVAAPVVAEPAAAAPQSAAPSVGSNSPTWYASTPADDAYWAAQPAAVQQLRGIDNLDERKQLGEQLANEGYSIDVPIMVWGWDAGKVTAARESYGYTWVPSALQQQVSAAPGVTGGGIIPYDSSHPPSGSIQV
jgi:hypothetical protein